MVASDTGSIFFGKHSQLKWSVFNPGLWTNLFGSIVIGVRFVVWSRALIPIYSHESVSLVICNLGAKRPVDRNLSVVNAKTMAMGVRIREKTSLKHLVDGGLNSGNHVARRKGCLLDLGKVVCRIPIEN